MMDYDELKMYVDTITLDDLVNEEIINSNSHETQFLIDLYELVRISLIAEINEFSKYHEDSEVIYAVQLQFSQVILTFKSTLLLSSYGYYTNSMINLRSLFETFFNIRYILLGESKKERNRRSKEFTQNKRPRKADGSLLSIYDKVLASPYLLDQAYYNAFYSSLSQYTHANYIGVAQQGDIDGIRTFPSSNKIDLVLSILSGVFYDLIEFLSKHLDFKNTFNELSKINKPEKFFFFQVHINEEIRKLKRKESI